ncbi:hypothetical protein [Luteolibacter sp. AS25]|uniref:hypothetical protein n=1 Tax=Luteolibacter sp. AS25 TaxID=3135776 RepID=UPI00398B9B74
MYPIDPVISASSSPDSPMAPPYVDEDPNAEMVEMGLKEAENERRDEATLANEEEALDSEDREEALDSVNYPIDDTKNGPSELDAIRKV